MNATAIEVMSQHYMGPLEIRPVYQNHSLFMVYLNKQPIGRAKPFRKQQDIVWYSHEITDKELLEQIGDWIAHHYPLTETSFKRVYHLKFF